MKLYDGEQPTSNSGRTLTRRIACGLSVVGFVLALLTTQAHAALLLDSKAETNTQPSALPRVPRVEAQPLLLLTPRMVEALQTNGYCQ